MRQQNSCNSNLQGTIIYKIDKNYKNFRHPLYNHMSSWLQKPPLSFCKVRDLGRYMYPYSSTGPRSKINRAKIGSIQSSASSFSQRPPQKSGRNSLRRTHR
ncbi:hypothetical protein I7I48_12005 [Histoplasma ohiense]|nr:hypothetical protein I7I48_12005 [Histoplasma ohiense (nom. inval.)]